MAKRTEAVDFHGVPVLDLELFAKSLLPDLRAFYENPDNLKAYEKWARERQQKEGGKSRKKRI